MIELQDLNDISEVVADITSMTVDDVIAQTLADSGKELQQIDCIEYLEDGDPEASSGLLEGSRKTSGVWRFYTSIFDEKDNEEFMYCSFCLNSDNIKRYKSTTATTNLLRHLRKYHAKEMLTDGSHLAEEGMEILPPKRIFGKTSDVWKYFCKLVKDNIIVDDDHFYCGKCLEKNVKKKYKKTTSTSSLKQHLQMHHGILFDDRIDEDNSGNDPAPKKVAGNKVSKIRLYFKKTLSDVNHIYCLFCLQDNRLHK